MTINRWVILLRGINVGGHNKLPMADLRSSLEKSGFEDIETYIQSGNVVCSSNHKDKANVQTAIRQLCHEKHGLDIEVWVGGAKEWANLANNNPYTQADVDSKSTHLFLAMQPIKLSDQQAGKLKDLLATHESYEVQANCLYLHAPKGIGKSKFAASVERLIGQPATARNGRTVQKITDLLS